MSHSDQDIRHRLLAARLPAMPQILLKLIELCQSDEAGMADIAKLIAHDAGMATKVLRVANSAAYMRSGRKLGLVQALSTLGSEMIKTLIISESVFQTFNGFPHTASTDLRFFWKHALTTAVMARDLAKTINYPQMEEAYLAGLLHDVGRLALLACAPDSYASQFHSQEDEKLCDIERESLQITHPEAGAWLIQRWNMDSFMSDSVLYHHEPIAQLETAHPLIRIVHLAQTMSEMDARALLVKDVGAFCNVTDDDVLTICRGAAGQVKSAADYLGIDLSGLTDPVSSADTSKPTPAPRKTGQGLSGQIRNMTLVAECGGVFNRQETDAGLLDSIRQSANILFELDESLVFLMSDNEQTLVGMSAANHRQRLARFLVPLGKSGGIAKSALQRCMSVLVRGRDKLSFEDAQILRVFDADGLVCLPFVANGRCLGMLVSGITAWRIPDLIAQEKFLMSFASQAALALDTSAKQRGKMDKRMAMIRDEFAQNSRKIVHEVSNPLSIIKNYLGVLDDKLARQEPVSGELSILNEEIDRVGSIIKTFAGMPPQGGGTSAEINQVINDIVKLFRDSKFLPPAVKIVARVSVQRCEIKGSADTLKQIFVNLIKNSIEALPTGGTIEIVNRGGVVREDREFYELSVKDSGTGIPVQILPKLFSPVQSSKPGENRGIGLSIVHGLVKQLQGEITCRSNQLGTTFEILIPTRTGKSKESALLHIEEPEA